MSAIKRMIGTAIGFAMVLAFTAGIVTLVLSLASEQLPGIKTIGAELRCIAGFPEAGSECVAQELAVLENERSALAEERERLGDVIAAQDFVFSQGDELKDGVNLVVGTLYANAARQTGLIRSFCWAIIDNGGLDPRVGLAVLHGDGRIEDVAVRADDLTLLEMSAGDVDAARSACPFPVVS